MKRVTVILLSFFMVISFFGCARNHRTDITIEEIVAIYEAAGYIVYSGFYDEKLDYGEIAYVQANHPNGDYIYFSIFETDADAKAYKEEFYHPAMMGLFSVIFGDPSWSKWEVCGCIVAQYDDENLFAPFEDLLITGKMGS